MTSSPTAKGATAPRDQISIRERLEDREDATLAWGATRSRGAVREHPETESPVRTAFQRDRDRITHASSFRRLMHKTQVFIAPSGDHYRTRLTHTLEVTQIARTIGRALGLNEDLIEAIGLSHDLGHTPFGHAGERALAGVFPGFRHNEQSLRVVDVLEKDGQGLNLTGMVRDGILRHSKGRASINGMRAGAPASPEGDVVRLSDAIAYINHDLDDALRARMVRWSDVPPIVGEVLGDTHAARINTLVANVVENSTVDELPPSVVLTDGVLEAADALRDFLYEQVYTPINGRRDTARAQQIVRELFHRYVERPDLMVPSGLISPATDPIERRVADHVAGLTDRSALEAWERHVLNG